MKRKKPYIPSEIKPYAYQEAVRKLKDYVLEKICPHSTAAQALYITVAVLYRNSTWPRNRKVLQILMRKGGMDPKSSKSIPTLNDGQSYYIRMAGGYKSVIREFFSDMAFIKETFESDEPWMNDPRYDEHFRRTIEVGYGLLGHCESIINPPVGIAPRNISYQTIKFHFCPHDDQQGNPYSIRTHEVLWALQKVYLSALTTRHSCTKGKIPGSSRHGATAYFSRLFYDRTAKDTRAKDIILEDVDNIRALIGKRGYIGDGSIISFLPETMNVLKGETNNKIEKLRDDLVYGGHISSSTTFVNEFLNYTSWHLKTSPSMKKIGETESYVIRGSAMILLGSLIAAWMSAWMLILTAISAYLIIYLYSKAKQLKPGCVAISMVHGIPDINPIEKIQKCIEEKETEALEENKTVLTRGEYKSTAAEQYSSMTDGSIKISSDCRISCYSCDYHLRKNFKAFLHQPDTEICLFRDLKEHIDPIEVRMAEDILPLVVDLKDNYLKYMDITTTRPKRDWPGKLHLNKNIFLFDYRTGRVGQVTGTDAWIDKTVFQDSMIAFKLRENSNMYPKFMMKILTSEYIREQLEAIDFDSMTSDAQRREAVGMLEIPVPNIDVQHRDLMLDLKEEMTQIIHDHKHNLGNSLKTLWLTIDSISDSLDETGQLSMDQVIYEERGETVRDIFQRYVEVRKEIVRQLNDFWENNKTEESFDLEEIISNYLKTHTPDEYSIQNRLISGIRVRFPKSDLVDILGHVLGNAERHGFDGHQAPHGHIVRIECNKSESDAGHINLVISNNGKGLAEGLTAESVMKDGVGNDGDSEHIGLGAIARMCQEAKGDFKFLAEKDNPEGFNIKYIISIPKEISNI